MPGTTSSRRLSGTVCSGRASLHEGGSGCAAAGLLSSRKPGMNRKANFSFEKYY